jgi:hypothetical protein
MTMNWRLGLFRLWLVAAILFALSVAMVSYSTVRDAFTESDFVEKWADNKDGIAMPQACAAARGIEGSDYLVGRIPGSDPFTKADRNCWYTMVDFRRLYPEFSKIPDEELADKQYRGLHAEVFGHPVPWGVLGYWVTVALGIPLAFLALGAALVWALSGFGVKRRTA